MSDTRARIIATTAALFRRQGFHGTGLKQIVAEAGAPFGSLYHFFPGGKDELAAAVIRSSGLHYQELIAAILDQAPDLAAGIRDCFDGAASLLRETDYADACPIETVALEVAGTNEALRKACADVFDGWIAEATRRIENAGIPRRKAREQALVFLNLLEGAFVLARTLKSTAPLTAASRAAVALFQVEHDGKQRRTRRVQT